MTVIITAARKGDYHRALRAETQDLETQDARLETEAGETGRFRGWAALSRKTKIRRHKEDERPTDL